MPLGNFPLDRYSYYYSEIIKNQSIELQSLTQYTCSYPSFPNRNFIDGRIWFDFIDNNENINNDWEIYQSYQRYMIIICIVYCPYNLDLNVIYNQFLNIKKKYNRSLRFKCFAFEPLDNIHIDNLEREHLIIFPNTGNDITHLRFYLSTYMQDIAAFLLQDFDVIVTTLDDTIYFNSPMDSTDLDINKAKKLRPGRMNKYKGDYCLLAGSPKDAILHYNIAIENCLDQDDYFWHAGALEGLASATLVKQLESEAFPFFPALANDSSRLSGNFKATSSTLNEADLDEIFKAPPSKNLHPSFNHISNMLPSVFLLPSIIDWLELAITLYSKYQNTSPQTSKALVECLYKLASYLSIHYERKGIKENILDCLRKASYHSTFLSIESQIVLSLHSALICRRIKAFRKFSWYLFNVSRLCSSITTNNYTLSGEYIKLSLFCMESITSLFNINLKSNDISSIVNNSGWLEFQLSILTSIIEFARELKEFDKFVNYSLYILQWIVCRCVQPEIIGYDYQKKLMNDILAFSPYYTTDKLILTPLFSMPLICTVQPVSLTNNKIYIPKYFKNLLHLYYIGKNSKLIDGYNIIDLDPSLEDEEDGFLYNPSSNELSKSELEQLIFSCEDTFAINVLVYNPLNILISLSNVKPSIKFLSDENESNSNFEPVKFLNRSAIVHAYSYSNLEIFGSCSSSGQLNIPEIEIRLGEKLSFNHQINSLTGYGSSFIHYKSIIPSLSKVHPPKNSSNLLQFVKKQPKLSLAVKSLSAKPPSKDTEFNNCFNLYLNHDQSNSFNLTLENTWDVPISSFSLNVFESFETEVFSAIFISYIVSEGINFIALFPHSKSKCSLKLSLLEFSKLLHFELPTNLENVSIFCIEKPVIFRLTNELTCILPKSNIELPLSLISDFNTKIKIIVEYSFHDFNVNSYCSASQFCRKAEILLNIHKEHGLNFNRADLIQCPRDLIHEGEFNPFLIPPPDNSKFQLILNAQNVCDDYFNVKIINNNNDLISTFFVEKRSERLLHLKFDKFSDEFSNTIRSMLNNDFKSINTCLQMISEEFTITWESKNNICGSVQLYNLWKDLDSSLLLSIIYNCLSDTLLISFFKDNNVSSATLSLSSISKHSGSYGFYRSLNVGFRFPCGMPVSITSSIINPHIVNINDVLIYIHPFKFLDSCLDFDVKEKVVFNGSWNIYIPTIPCLSSSLAEFGFIILEPGEFMFYFTTNPNDTLTDNFNIVKNSIRILSD